MRLLFLVAGRGWCGLRDEEGLTFDDINAVTSVLQQMRTATGAPPSRAGRSPTARPHPVLAPAPA